MGHRIGIDVGGTFTDFVFARDGREVVLTKVPTTLPDQSQGVMNGIAAIAEGEGVGVRALLERTDLIVHGTTTADNTMIEMNGAVTGLITTAGHRDEIEIRRGYKEEHLGSGLPAADSDRAAPPPHRRARAARLPRRRRHAARRGGRAPRGAAPAQAGRRVDRRVPAVLLHQSGAREARAGDRRGGVPGRARLALARGDADGAGVRAHLDHAGRRLRGTARRELPEAPAGARCAARATGTIC